MPHIRRKVLIRHVKVLKKNDKHVYIIKDENNAVKNNEHKVKRTLRNEVKNEGHVQDILIIS